MNPDPGRTAVAPHARAMPAPTVSGAIDRSSPVPYHHQLKELLRDEIESGRWPAGERIPSEPELCRSLDVSRTVVRQALGALENERMLRRRKGLGTFVAEPKIRGRLVQTLTGFHDDMLAQGRTPRTVVLRQAVTRAGRKIGDRLGIPSDAPVVVIERVRLVDGEPIVFVTTYLPADLVPGLERIDLTDSSLYQTLATRFDLHIHHGRRSLESIRADDEVAARLHVEAGEPVLFIRSVTYLGDGRAIEYYEASHRGDRSVLEVTLVRERDHAGSAP
jgi:GntR family transcriptional regulator